MSTSSHSNNSVDRGVAADASAGATLQDLLNEGSRLIQARRLQEAQALSQALLGKFGDKLEVRFFASDVESLRGDAAAALEQLEALSEPLQNTARVLIRKAQLCLFDGQWDRALSCSRAVDLLEATESELSALSQLFTQMNQLKEARNCLLIARDKNPDSVPLLYLLAVSEAQLDLLTEAQKHTDQVLSRSPDHPGALHLRAQLRPWTKDHNHIEDLRRILANNPDGQLKAIASYALGKELGDLGDDDGAFAAFSEGAAAYRSLVSYDPAIELGAHQDIRGTFTSARLTALEKGSGESGPLFVVGMPRSGVRLFERAMAGHSAISGSGELGEFRRLLGVLASSAAPAEVSDAEATLAVNFAELGQRYRESARAQTGDGSHFIDSTSHNFLYCGHILAAMPGAKIIHVKRDALDNCHSLFKTLIFGAHSYSYDLDEIADYFLSYRAHMQHWHSLFPEQILDVSYEALLEDPVAEVQRVLDFCGLPFEEGMLDSDTNATVNMLLSASKVLPPLHRESLGTARRVGAGLDGLRARFREAGLA